MICQCRSYNRPDRGGDESEAILTPPRSFDLRHSSGERKEKISIDACIAHVVQYLWNHDIVTMNSCCGHNDRPPSIIFEDQLSEEKAQRIKDLIAMVDSRQFKILSWKLVNVGEEI